MAFFKDTSSIRTRFLILSDTHGMTFPEATAPGLSADVAIHCGDLTHHSKLDEFRESIQMLKGIRAPFKLVIAGNHDFTLDVPTSKRKLLEENRLAHTPLETTLVNKEFGDFGAARQL